MGLDSYLTGRLFFWNFGDGPQRKEDGRRVKSLDVELGYWRKHPDLHGYFVQTFMEGRDECQEIELSAEDLRQTIEAVRSQSLPHTTGFFFGYSMIDEPEIERDCRILQSALEWLEASDVAPVELGPPEAIGGGFAIAAVKEDKTQEAVAALAGKEPPAQRATRSVHYHASW